MKRIFYNTFLVFTLLLVAGVLAAGVARGIRAARAAASGAASRPHALVARGRRVGSLVSRHSL
ncbi:MAG TPA: hypothetical protein VIP46_06015 [Pyrinomonadaceae bacterium]